MLMSAQQIKSVKVTNLNFDPENPRFAAANWGGLDSNEIIETMLDREQVIDLINYISWHRSCIVYCIREKHIL